MNAESFKHAVDSSGGILYVMAVLLFIALTVALERLWYLRRLAIAGKELIASLDAVARPQPAMLRELSDKYRGLPYARLLETVCSHNIEHDFDHLSDKLEEAIMREIPCVDRYLWVLDTITTLAPLLGLLGTIIGMFGAFQVLSDPGTAPTRVTGGVAEALLATACGLFIAILGLVFFNGLNNRVRLVLHHMETLKRMLTNRMHPNCLALTIAHPNSKETVDSVRLALRRGDA
ncbi:MAG: MotA/TolQ/ExbB proton channel family protein [Burkholderiales bacterium]|nr:MotA/TolQ/ExbB proton channel family protein [Burkholderiales bacterium]MDE2432362.1 MotA/TolQ/ExbB proton channel family protein [Burkholderiales bacterium]